MVSTGRLKNAAIAVVTKMATNEPGILCVIFGQSNTIVTVMAASENEYQFTEDTYVKYAVHLKIKSAGTAPICNPRRSFTCEERITNAMPLVNPIIKGYGINFITDPNFARPMITSMMPARK